MNWEIIRWARFFTFQREISGFCHNRVGLSSSRAVWLDLAKIRYFGKFFQSVANILWGFMVFGKFLNRLWQFLWCLGNFHFCKYWTNNLAIRSHWSCYTILGRLFDVCHLKSYSQRMTQKWCHLNPERLRRQYITLTTPPRSKKHRNKYLDSCSLPCFKLEQFVLQKFGWLLFYFRINFRSKLNLNFSKNFLRHLFRF